MITRSSSMRFLTFAVLFLSTLISCTSRSPKKIVQGTIWYDDQGKMINAHGGGILYHNGIYYWYGEYKGDSTYRLNRVKTWECWRADAGGISCYSSKNLVDWKFEGIVLPTVQDSLSDLHPSQVIERPKVIYNERTGKFVMWMHIESPDYEKAHAGVAVSDHPNTRFTYLGSFKPNGADSRDQTIYKDDDGRAYQIAASEWNKTLYISLLNDSFTRPTGVYTRAFVNQSREAPVIFKYHNKYYMITSGCTGWDPNMAQYAIADSILGKWSMIGNSCRGKDSEITFKAQGTFVLQVDGRKDLYIVMFDRWNKIDLDDSRYIWLPVLFHGDKIEIPWKKKWNPNKNY
jgi:beta-galactosidase